MNPFQRRPLGQTALSLTILGFGGSSVGNLFRLVAEEDASSAVAAACRAGIRYFDTAPYAASGAGAAPSLASPPCSMELRTVIE